MSLDFALFNHAAVLAIEPYAMITGAVLGAILGGILGAFVFGSSVCSSARVHGSTRDLKRPGHIAAGVGVTLLFAAMGYGLGGIIGPVVAAVLVSELFWLVMCIILVMAVAFFLRKQRSCR